MFTLCLDQSAGSDDVFEQLHKADKLLSAWQQGERKVMRPDDALSMRGRCNPVSLAKG